MTRVFGVDENNDLVIGPDGNLTIERDLEAVLQSAQQHAQAQYGEMILAVDEGVANFDTIWKRATNVIQFEAFVRQAILDTPGVTEIRDFNVTVQNNTASYIATIVTIYGEGQISG